MPKKAFILILLTSLLLNVSCGQKPVTDNIGINVDVDISALSATMAYALVNEIGSDPSRYLGKTIKIRGIYDFSSDPETNTRYDVCVVSDATGCCFTGFEIEFAASSQLPVLNHYFTVIGTFDTYEENGQTFCILRNAVLTEVSDE